MKNHCSSANLPCRRLPAAEYLQSFRLFHGRRILSRYRNTSLETWRLNEIFLNLKKQSESKESHPATSPSRVSIDPKASKCSIISNQRMQLSFYGISEMRSGFLVFLRGYLGLQIEQLHRFPTVTCRRWILCNYLPLRFFS